MTKCPTDTKTGDHNLHHYQGDTIHYQGITILRTKTAVLKIQLILLNIELHLHQLQHTSTYSWRHGNSRTYGAPSDVFSSSDVKTSASHHSGTSAASSLGTSSFSRKSSLGRDKGGSLPSSPTKTRETSHLYSVRHVATFAHRDSNRA